MNLLIATLVYNTLLTGIVAILLIWLYRRPTGGRVLMGATALAVVAAVTALLCSPTNPLRAARFLAFGCFLQLPAFLLIAAWRSNQNWQRCVWTMTVVLIAGLAIDMFFVEPFRLEITHERIESELVDRPLRLALFADFQTDVLGDYEHRSLRALMAGKPDVVVMSGDYLQAANQQKWSELCSELNAILKELPLEAPQGIFAVGGNVDFQRWPEIFKGLPVTVCEQSQINFGDQFSITCLSMEDSFRTDLTVPRPDDRLHIVLGHAPDYALGDVDAELLVAGHTHGGQVRLPWIGPLVTFSRVPRDWAAGLTRLDRPGIDKQGTLVVSRGVGMERRDAPRLRFLCRPQIVFVDIVPQQSAP